MYDNVEDFLEHYGVKGMKWGVRKKTQKEQREIAKRKKISKNRRTLSDADIKAYINRLESERKLKSLIEEDLTPGRKVAKKLMSEGGQKVVKTVATGAVLYGLKIGIGNKFKITDIRKHVDLKEAAKFMVPNPNKK